MKNLDQFSRRLLAISISLSIILLSGSLFILSLSNLGKANAHSYTSTEFKLPESVNKQIKYSIDSLSENDLDESIFAVQAFGLGIREGKVYFGILYNNNTIGLHKAEADGEDVLVW